MSYFLISNLVSFAGPIVRVQRRFASKHTIQLHPGDSMQTTFPTKVNHIEAPPIRSVQAKRSTTIGCHGCQKRVKRRREKRCKRPNNLAAESIIDFNEFSGLVCLLGPTLTTPDAHSKFEPKSMMTSDPIIMSSHVDIRQNKDRRREKTNKRRNEMGDSWTINKWTNGDAARIFEACRRMSLLRLGILERLRGSEQTEARLILFC